jgi:hypothetical protein
MVARVGGNSRAEGKHTEARCAMAMPQSAIKDKNYDLVTVLQMSLENSWRMQHFIDDAEREGDSELAGWFRKIRDNNLKASDQGKAMLQKRLQQD